MRKKEVTSGRCGVLSVCHPCALPLKERELSIDACSTRGVGLGASLLSSLFISVWCCCPTSVTGEMFCTDCDVRTISNSLRRQRKGQRCQNLFCHRYTHLELLRKRSSGFSVSFSWKEAASSPCSSSALYCSAEFSLISHNYYIHTYESALASFLRFTLLQQAIVFRWRIHCRILRMQKTHRPMVCSLRRNVAILPRKCQFQPLQAHLAVITMVKRKSWLFSPPKLLLIFGLPRSLTRWERRISHVFRGRNLWQPVQ